MLNNSNIQHLSFGMVRPISKKTYETMKIGISLKGGATV